MLRRAIEWLARDTSNCWVWERKKRIWLGTPGGWWCLQWFYESKQTTRGNKTISQTMGSEEKEISHSNKRHFSERRKRIPSRIDTGCLDQFSLFPPFFGPKIHQRNRGRKWRGENWQGKPLLCAKRARPLNKDADKMTFQKIYVISSSLVLVFHFPTRFLSLLRKFLLADSILTFRCTEFWRSFVTYVAWKSGRVTSSPSLVSGRNERTKNRSLSQFSPKSR